MNRVDASSWWLAAADRSCPAASAAGEDDLWGQGAVTRKEARPPSIR